jgi:hypothetical protein
MVCPVYSMKRLWKKSMTNDTRITPEKRMQNVENELISSPKI